MLISWVVQLWRTRRLCVQAGRAKNSQRLLSFPNNHIKFLSKTCILSTTTSYWLVFRRVQSNLCCGTVGPAFEPDRHWAGGSFPILLTRKKSTCPDLLNLTFKSPRVGPGVTVTFLCARFLQPSSRWQMHCAQLNSTRQRELAIQNLSTAFADSLFFYAPVSMRIKKDKRFTAGCRRIFVW